MKMKQLLFGLFAAAVAVLCGAGCACANGACGGAAPLAGSEWKLDLASLAGTESRWTKPEKTVTLAFAAGKEAGRVSGCAGVNRYFGPVTYDDAAGTIRFGNLGATMMAGPGLEYERAYLKMLGGADRFAIRNDRLILMAGNVPVAEFSREK